jgi:hypothetical protein
MSRTIEQIDEMRGLRAEIAATRGRLTDGSWMPDADRRLEGERLQALTAKLLELEDAARPPPPPPVLDPEQRITRDEAAKRAKEIRARPEFWNSGLLRADGTQVISHEAHAQLVREVAELDAIALGDARAV